MRNQNYIQIGIILATLCASLAVAEESSVSSIMAELNQASSAMPAEKPAAPRVVAAEPAVEAPPAVVEPVAVAVEPIDVDVVVEESREYYVAADYLRARQGFESVLNQDPRNIFALHYLKKIDERQRRTTEETALDVVENSWNGMVFRDYALSVDALKTIGISNETEAVDVTDEFPEVTFPKGAYALYRPNLNRLFVQNTQVNMNRMEAIMASLDAPRKGQAGQVKIEARFVEFSEGALEELGFVWNKDNTEDLHLGGDWNLPAGQSLFADSLRTVPFDKTGSLGLGETRGPASPGWSVNRLEDMFSDEAGTLSLFGELDGDNGDSVELLVRALDQTSGADVLSAPSIVTLSGEKATITVGERHNYPTTYEEGVSSGTILHVKYEDFEEKILGVEMGVTPTITGDEINLEINPKIIELAGWQQFLLASADTSYTYYQYRVGMQYEHEPIVAKLPVFKRREVETEISVSSGSTVGMGGLISEKLEEFEDRVPVLGSIPLVGRLFRSEGQRTVKRNLMIFVTATKVEPGGRMVSTRTFE